MTATTTPGPRNPHYPDPLDNHPAGEVLRAMRAAPAAQGRHRLDDVTVGYLGALADGAHLAIVDADAHDANANARVTLSPVGLREALAGSPLKGVSLNYPPSLIWATIVGADARRVDEGRHIAAYAAQWYAYVAVNALRAVVAGEHITAADLERIGDAHNGRRPAYAFGMRLWDACNRPNLPALDTLATGHNDLDVAVGTAWAHLSRVYVAAERLETPAPPDETAGATLARLSRLDRFTDTVVAGDIVTALDTLGAACYAAARFGHADPTADPLAAAHGIGPDHPDTDD